MPTLSNGHLVSFLALLFLLPSLLFASYLALVPRIVTLAGGLAALVLLLRRPAVEGSFLARPIVWRRLGFCALIAIGLIVLGGEDHIVFVNWDWLWRDAVLADVVRSPSLPTYQVDGATYWLRAPLGMYLLPAAIGRLTSLEGAHLALLGQNVALLAGLLYLFVSLATKRGFVLLATFLAFAGLDLIATIVFRVLNGEPPAPFALPSMIGGSVGVLQYTAHVTQLFWVPNHTLPGWWLAILVILCVAREIGLGELGLSLAIAMLWSPLAIIGAIPFACLLLFRRLRESVTDTGFYLSTLAAVCFLPIAVYLCADAASVPHRLLIATPDFWIVVVIFLALKLPHGFVLGATWRRLRPELRPLFVVAIGILVLLPTVQFGANNDLLMRGSIPALAILAFAFGEIVTQGARPQPVAFAAALLILSIGAATPLFEIVRALRFPRFAISDCNLITVWKSQLPDLWLANYLADARRVPKALLATTSQPPLVDEKRACWPDHPFDPKMAVWKRTNAELDASMRARHRKNDSK